MNEQVKFYESKIAFEIDSWDVFEAQKAGHAIVVLDARSETAFGSEHIRGAISFPHRLMTSEGTRSFDKSSLYVVYCDGIGCNASSQGALKLARLGFNVKELIGGLDWWKRSGFPTEGAKVARTDDVNCGCS